MVASSVVSTILILNYHHRNADTHEMSEWVRYIHTHISLYTLYITTDDCCWHVDDSLFPLTQKKNYIH